MKDNIIFLNSTNSLNPDFEFVERKGMGHPDTLADWLAERLSYVYSKYTKEHFWAILHHNFDKVGLLWWASHVEFWDWYLTKPIRVLLTWRASTKFWDTDIDVESMLINETKNFMKERLPMINVEKDLEMHYLLSNKSSPWKVDKNAKKQWTRKFRFEPRDLSDLKELTFLWSNDTSLWCWYFPYSFLENLILQIEWTLNSNEYKKDKPWLWSDIKLMWTRYKDKIDITLCVPQICTFVKDIEDYKNHLEIVENTIDTIFEKLNKESSLNITEFSYHINTRDDYDTCELYLTATWSSIESGDEWLVGRWNRINWVISPMKPMSMEWSAGKNPVYHIGKVYYIAAQEIAEKVSKLTNSYTEVYLVSQSWRDLLDPWKTLVYTDLTRINESELLSFIENELKHITNVTNEFLQGKFYY